MRRIDLLPVAYVERKRQRRSVLTVAVAGLLVFLLLLVWMFTLTTQISTAEDDLAAVQQRNQLLQAQIDELARFAQLEAEVNAKRTALQTVMAGDVDWPALLTEIAMVTPGEVWLESVATSASQTEGETLSPTETAPIRVSNKTPAGRMRFTGKSVCMPGVAKWLIRLGTVESFSAVWLNTANELDTAPGCEVIQLDNSIEFSEEALSGRFQGELE